ncbi:hypothetical protein Bca4012_010337 [Brassica carinata]|uniref:Uncharacterized protein n=1 Tax=Brassica carinata TaxID=52824 RepID=A0A8X7V2K2_BRACI|nr:hypothetical protein Bca52824_035288 [Brassica carinata]
MAATVRSDDSGASGHAVMARAEFTVTTEDGNGGVVVQQRHNGEETTWTRGPVVENCDEAHRRYDGGADHEEEQDGYAGNEARTHRRSLILELL